LNRTHKAIYLIISISCLVGCSSSPSLSSPEGAVDSWMNAWMNRDWPAMASASQITWRKDQSDPEGMLRDMFGWTTLSGYEIERVSGNALAAREVSVLIYYELTGEPATGRIEGRVIGEIAPYRPDPNGTWGVNPVSMSRIDRIGK